MITLQKYIRGYLSRKHHRANQKEQDKFIGMVMPPPLSKKNNPINRMNRATEARHVTQDQYETQYQNALVSIRKKISQVEGPDMSQNMCDEIREW